MNGRFYLAYFLIINCSYVFTNSGRNTGKQHVKNYNSIKHGGKGHEGRSNYTTGQTVVRDEDKSSREPSSTIERRRLNLYPEWLSKRVQDFVGKHFPHKYFHTNPHTSNNRDVVPRKSNRDKIAHHIHTQDTSNTEKQDNYRRSFFRIPDLNHGFGNNLQSNDNEMFTDAQLDASDMGINGKIPVQIGASDVGMNGKVPMQIGAPDVGMNGKMPLQISGAPDVGANPARMPVPQALSNLGAELVDIPPRFREPRFQEPRFQEVAPNSLADYIREKAVLAGQQRGEDHQDWLNFDGEGGLSDGRFHHHHKHLFQHHPCRHHTCLNGGHCHYNRHHRNRYRCHCREGFRGHYCEVIPFSCHPNPCKNDGICTKREKGYSCSCDTLFKGGDCTVKAICPSAPCRNGGTCVELEHDFVCRCPPLFSGTSCENKISTCSSNPCKNGGTCSETGTTFKCKCGDGFSCDDCSCKSAATAVAVRPMPTSCPANTCHNGGSCLVTQTGYSCQCLPLFHGSDCAIPDTCTPNPCENGGLCVQVGDDYKCVCSYGYKGTNCREQLACITHPCTNGGMCHELDEAGFHCKCEKGYKGATCTELSPCGTTPCAHEADCTEEGPLYTCICKAGFLGKECNERDPCSPSPCKNDGGCHLVRGIAKCNCTSSWNGDLCEIKNECHPNKCQNGGTCVHNGELIHCVCTDEFHGPNCETQNPCFVNPCKRNGMCQLTETSYICICSQGDKGKNCEVPGLCHPNPCRHGGVCYEGDETFICECPAGYAGKMCEIQDFCEADRCHNGGSCVEEIGSFSCTCPLGFLGDTCATSVCLPNPCKNGGTCMPSNTEHGYACECVFPFHGQNCGDIDPCLPNPCRNGGSCKSHLKEIKELHLHEGEISSLVHGSDDSVVTVVGPEESEPEAFEHEDNFHHPDRYEEHIHSIPHRVREYDDRATYGERAAAYGDRAAAYGDSYFGRHHGGAINSLRGAMDPHHGSDHRHGIVGQGFAETEEPHRHPHIEETSEPSYHAAPAVHDLAPEPEPYLPSEESEDAADHAVPGLHHDDLHHNSQLGGIQGEVYGLDESHHARASALEGDRSSKLDADAVAKISQSVIKAVLEQTKKHGYLKRSNVSKKTNSRRSSVQKRTLQDLYVCQCLSGFLGAHCQHANPCERSPCKNGGTCIPRGARYQCNCPVGYGGLKCDDW